MKLSNKLLSTEEEFNCESTLNGTSIKGAYNTMRFVLRLSDDIRFALDSEFEPEKIQASSTVIHENIHWWQHIGSNFGLLFSLVYPAFAHSTNKNLSRIISSGYKYKSIKKFDEHYYKKHNKSDIGDINMILNNFYDLEYAKLFALDNKNIEHILKDRRFFLNIGHSYHILWSNTIHTLASTIDPKYNFLPKVNNWLSHFKKLEENKVTGFHIDSDIYISPLGIKAIYEGQAIFNQLQYLTLALNEELTYEDFENYGMLHGIYIEAFEFFLKTTQLNKPSKLLNPVVGLFLFACDLSINPNNGFPNEIYDINNFISKNDPGIRFYSICNKISEDPNAYINIVNRYSKEEYINLSKKLSEGIGCKCYYESINDVLTWSKFQEVSSILKEEEELKYSYENLPIRLIFSKYYRFQEDKYKYPNVFCWFGFHATSKNSNIDFKSMNDLFNKHHALYTDDIDGEIKPTLYKGKSEKNIMDTFNTFYQFNILYDLIFKWVSEEGEFNFDYKWLFNKRAETEIPAIKDMLEKYFNIALDEIKIL
ncbi:hypothetical protein [Aquimarina algiphila]|uniref:hypothetical protein n=1 Tax=Aquimarina algiphila TaxID=2047982 RepID=UPI00232E9FA8|nr:hypothetical protein [Aquimarina algiphila]